MSLDNAPKMLCWTKTKVKNNKTNILIIHLKRNEKLNNLNLTSDIRLQWRIGYFLSDKATQRSCNFMWLFMALSFCVFFMCSMAVIDVLLDKCESLGLADSILAFGNTDNFTIYDNELFLVEWWIGSFSLVKQILHLNVKILALIVIIFDLFLY